MRAITTCVLGLLAAGCSWQEAPRGREIGLEVDAARLEGLGLAPDAAPEALEALLERRLTVAGVQAEVEVRDGRAHVVTAEERPLAQLGAIASMLEQIGRLELLLVADEDAHGFAEEKARFEAWRAAYPDAPLAEYERAPERTASEILWLPVRRHDGRVTAKPVVLPASPEVAFGASDLRLFGATHDRFGYPALQIVLAPEREAAFHEFTGKHVGRELAVVIGSEIRSAPTLAAPLEGSFLLEGRFEDAEVLARIRGERPVRVGAPDEPR